jgi:hypothetical protein
MKKPKADERTPTGLLAMNVWIYYPATIHWIREERNKSLALQTFPLTANYKGMNATIILLSACCIEGFLSECLKSFANPFKPPTSLENRLERDYLETVNYAMLGDLPDLFRMPLGKPLKDLLNNEPLYKSFEMLSSLRNLLAHAKSVTYKNFDFYAMEVPVTDYKYELTGKQKALEDYLVKLKLIKRNELMLTHNVADHFGAFVKTFIEAVVPLLPEKNQKSMKILLMQAGNEIPRKPVP